MIRPTYYSEHGQDRWLAEGIFKDKLNGVFVEIGAFDGRNYSNSLFFEESRGWSGLLVEANPLFSDAIKVNRPNATIIMAAIYDRRGTVNFEQGLGPPGWNGIGSEFEPQHRERFGRSAYIEVPCMPLSDALHGAGLSRVDYLSVDVEGAEVAIFRAFPFAEFDIDVIGIENNWNRPDLDAILLPSGYEKIARVGIDDMYRRVR